MAFSTQVTNRLKTMGGFKINWLIWIAAKNRNTGATEAIGLWDGDDTENFTIGGNVRTYNGALGLFGLSDLTFGTGTVIRSQTLQIGPITPAVRAAIHTYEPRFAPVEIHAMVSFSDGYSELDRRFKGFIDKLPSALPGINDAPTATLTLVSAARLGTRVPHLRKSDEAQRKRNDDRFRQYSDISGVVPVWWGENRTVVKGTEASTRVARTGPSAWGN